MDVDISDILASVSRPPAGQPTSRHATTDSSVSTDHQLLVRSWTSERCSPALLPYPTELMARVMQRVQAQITKIEDLTSAVPDANGANGHGYGHGNTNSLANSKNLNLILSILQTDLSRTQFIVRSFLRQRLSKITKHAVYYLTQLASSEDKSNSTLLSQSETQFLRHHQSLLSNFYDASFLSSFPPKMRRLDDTSGGMGNVMVEGPDEASAVIVRCLGEGWGNEESVERGRRGGEGEAGVELRMRRGEVWVVRWGDVRGGVGEGGLELL